MSTLYVQVLGGLCSRLRAVLGAIAYCDHTGKSLDVCWPTVERTELHGEFPARLTDLWTCPFAVRDRSEHKHAAYGVKQVVPVQGRDLWVRTADIEPWLPYLVTTQMRRYVEHLMPTDAVTHLVAADIGLITRPAVGLVVRYWDSQPEAVGPEWYVSRLEDILQTRAAKSIYLFTDHSRPGEVLRSAFGELVVEHEVRRVGELPVGHQEMAAHGKAKSVEKAGQGKDVRGLYVYDKRRIIQAAASLYVLADHCDWVLGSPRSSYAETVAWMRGAALTGPLHRPGNYRGGRIEDAWNPPDEEALARCL